MPSSSASFDLLFVAEELSLKLGTATVGEIHLFSYLGCLLSLFEGQPVADLGYSFGDWNLGRRSVRSCKRRTRSWNERVREQH